MNQFPYKAEPAAHIAGSGPTVPAIDPSLRRLFTSLGGAPLMHGTVNRTASGVYVATTSKLLLPASYDAANKESHIRG